jgi:DNA-binding IclR family transcriptional regulator
MEIGIMTAGVRVAKREKRDYAIQTVRNCLRVLAAFHDERELGVTELARRLDLHKNNVFRLLATLQEEGYVEKNEETDCYRLGIACLELAHAFARNRSFPLMARPVLAELVRATGESAHLGVLADFAVMHLDSEEPDRLVRTSSRIARRLPAHCTALGKVLLGCGEPRQLEAYDQQVVAAGLHPFTASTLVDRDKLFAHLHTVGAQGYALDLEECEIGLCCAAAPIHDERGRVVAAISVSGPSFRLEADALEQRIAPAVVRAADGLSRSLGYPGSSV